MDKSKSHPPAVRSFSISTLWQKTMECFRMINFFLDYKNDIVAYHRQVCFVAVLPLIYASFIGSFLYSGYVHTLFLRKAIQFICMMCVCYAAVIMQTKLLPRNKTFEQWKSFMSTQKHSHPIKFRLLAFHKQIIHGNAPAEYSRNALDVPEETFNIWRTKLHGLSPDQVKVKYVNFCWRVSYRLWCNKINFLTSKVAAENSDYTDEECTVKIESLSSLNTMEFQGDFTKTEAAKRLLPKNEFIKLSILKKLAERVNAYATALQGDSGGPEDPEVISHYRKDGDPILARLKSQFHHHAR